MSRQLNEIRVNVFRVVAYCIVLILIFSYFGLNAETALIALVVATLNAIVLLKKNFRYYFLYDFTFTSIIIGSTGGASAGHAIFLPILCLFYSFSYPKLVDKVTSLLVIVGALLAALGDEIFPKVEWFDYGKPTVWEVVIFVSSSFLLFYFGGFLAKRVNKIEERIANLVDDVEDVVSAIPYPLFVFRRGECVYRNEPAEKTEIHPDSLLASDTIETAGCFYKVCKLISPKQSLQIALLVDLATRNADKGQFTNETFLAALDENPELQKLVSRSPVMTKVKSLIWRVASTDATVLLTGESGTGKTLIARLIHNLSDRREKPFISVDCGSIPPDLLESELFGSVKGAFTGAIDRKGLFLEAQGGTIFLDEIGELSPNLQVKLLQVLQEKRVRPLGKSEYYDIDVRIICATNRNLEEAVKQKLFREDLYFRINVVRILVPPLRERLEDVPALVENFLAKRNKKSTKITPEAMQLLLSYDYPGNIRELENILERALVLASNDVISADHIQFTQNQANVINNQNTSIIETDMPLPVDLEGLLNTIESKLILRALQLSNQNRTDAAKLLNISQRSLRYRIKKLNLQVI